MEARNLKDLEPKKRIQRPITKDDKVENPEEFDELSFFLEEDKKTQEASKEFEDQYGKTSEIKKLPSGAFRQEEPSIKKTKVSISTGNTNIIITIEAVFKEKPRIAGTIPSDWIVSKERFMSLTKKEYRANFFIYVDLVIDLFAKNQEDTMSDLKYALFLVNQAKLWENDANCLYGRVSIQYE